ncbi:MAG: DeoR/GlpR family DNA-binding transcription regulator [Hespellia sp.]|nr:DeoR/GlpR family DNA-binding transcription regulator [Hespellia sp.]
MYSLERKAEIINLIETKGHVSVAELSELFHTSKETIRRDIRELEQEHALARTHGGAVALQPTLDADSLLSTELPVSVRGIRNYQAKNDICKKAASYIQSGDTVFVDNSSTTIYLAQYIPADIQVTFITNSLKFLIEASNLQRINQTYICLGGIFRGSNLSVYGNSTLNNARGYYPNKVFLSCAGITSERMLTDASIQEVDTKKVMMELSKEVFVLADHTKFVKNGQVSLSHIDGVNHIITDTTPPEESIQFLQNHNIDLVISN